MSDISRREHRCNLRVSHVLDSIDNLSAGPTYTVTGLSKSLTDMGCTTSIFCRSAAPSLEIPGVSVNSHAGPPVLGHFGVSPKLFNAMRDAAGEVDIFHTHGLWLPVNIYAARAIRHGSSKMVWSPRGMLMEWAWRHKWLKKQVVWHSAQKGALESVDLVHVTAEPELEDVRRRGLRQPVAVIPNGVDVADQPTARNSNSEARTILFLGRIHKIKGLDILLEAWSAVETDFANWELRIVGPDDYGSLAGLQDQAARLNLKRVFFEGPLFGGDKLSAMASSDLFILPSHSENFGLVVAEALAQGTPVITTTGTPWTDLERRRCGWWVRPDVAAITDTLRGALSLPAGELEAMGQRGHEWMRDEFSWHTVADNMVAAYEWVLGRGPKPACILD